MATSVKPYVFRAISPSGEDDLTENQDVSILFDCPYSKARLYLGLLDQHSGLHTPNTGKDSNGDIYHFPASESFRLTTYEDEDLRVGSYPVKIVIGADTYHERLTVRPSHFSLDEWTVMEKDLDRACGGLSCAKLSGPLRMPGAVGEPGHIRRARQALGIVRRAASGALPEMRDLCAWYLALVRRTDAEGEAGELLGEISGCRIPGRPSPAAMRGRPASREEALIRAAAADLRNGAFGQPFGPEVTHKKSSTLYEFWSTLELVRLFGDYSCKLGGEVEYAEDGDGLPVLKDGFRIAFRRGHVIYELNYSPEVPDTKTAGILYTVGRHCLPDMIVNIFDDRLGSGPGDPGFIGSVVIEVKYRKLHSFWHEPHLGVTGSAMDQIYSYYNDFRSDRVFLSGSGARPVLKVLILSPEHTPRTGLGGAVENVGFTPGRDNSALVRKILRIGDDCSKGAFRNLKEAISFVKAHGPSGQL